MPLPFLHLCFHCRAALPRYVAEGGQWGRELQQAYWAVSDGSYGRALLGYAWAAELGFDTGRGGLAHLLGDRTMAGLLAPLCKGPAGGGDGCAGIELGLWQALAGHGLSAGKRARDGDLVLEGEREGSAIGRAVPAVAFLELGKALLAGDGVAAGQTAAVTRQTALAVLSKAVDRGSLSAMLLLAGEYELDVEAALWAELDCSQRLDPASQARAVDAGLGCLKNLTLAADLYALAVERGGAPPTTRLRLLAVRWRLAVGDLAADAAPAVLLLCGLAGVTDRRCSDLVLCS